MPGITGRDILAEPHFSPAKIGVLRASRIGDFICATPAFRALNHAFPGAEISLIALPFIRALAERSPYIHRYIEFPGFPGIADQFYDSHSAEIFLQRMRAQRFDVVLQMHGSGVYSNPIVAAMRAKVSAGFVRSENDTHNLDAAFPYDERRHEVLRLLDFLRFLGIEAGDTRTKFALYPEDRKEALAQLAGLPRPLIGLHASARVPTKRWPVVRFREVGEELHNRWGGTIVWVGDTTPEINTRESAFRDFTRKTSLPMLGAIIELLDLLITNDSGPAHIAYATGTPTVTIFGSTEPSRWKALNNVMHETLVVNDIPCRPCDYHECPIDYPCLLQIETQQVLEAATRLLQEALKSA